MSLFDQGLLDLHDELIVDLFAGGRAMMPVIHRDARSERRESIKVALVILAVCLMILAALWPDKPRKDPYTAIPETGIRR